MNKNIRKIGIDARFYGPIGKGLGRYTQEIVDNVIKADTENQYVIFLSPENFHEFECDNKRDKKILVKARWYSFAEQIVFPFIIWRQSLDLIHFTHFNVPVFTPTRFIVTVHDLILTKFPTVRASTLSPIFYWFKNLGYKFVIWLAVKRAKKVIAVSNNTKEDIIKQFKVKEDKVSMIYEGVSDKLSNVEYRMSNKNKKEVLSKYNITEPFLLYVGNVYPHKNLESLVRIFPKLKQEYPDLNLVLVGKEDYFYSRLKEYSKKISSPVIFAGFVPDEDLRILFKSAALYVFPSFYEGFGLPPLEAMSQGCAVVSSGESCMKEVLGEAAVYFDPRNEEDMIKQIKVVLEDDNLKKNLVEKGYEQVGKYSWEDAARETLRIYKEVI